MSVYFGLISEKVYFSSIFILLWTTLILLDVGFLTRTMAYDGSTQNDTLQMIPQRRPNKNSRPYLETESDYGLLRPSLRAIQISCYSCMSSEFEKHWSTLSLLYNRPKNFTDLCLDIPRRSRIGYVPCDSACLTIVERRISGGILVTGKPNGYNVARGCLSNVFKVNLESKMRTLRRTAATSRSICDEMDTGDVIPMTHTDDRGGRGYSPYTSPVHKMTLCTCYGDLCNHTPLSGGRRNSIFMWDSLSLYSSCVLLIRTLLYRV